MIPTLTNVYDAARSYLGDDQTSGGEIFTNTLLAPYLGIAYREMWRAMAVMQNPRVKRTKYYTLPAEVTILVPSTANISDLGVLESVEERGSLTKYTLTGGTINSSVPSVTFTTASTAGLSNSSFVTINGNMALTGTDGFWGIENVTATQFDAMGMVATGTFSGSGQAVHSSEQFSDVTDAGDIRLLWTGSGSVNSRLGLYVYSEGVFHFPLCNAERQLRITYWSDGALPSSASDSTGIEDSLNFLAARTAGLAAGSRGNLTLANYCNQLALGPSMTTSAWAGFLGDLLYPVMREAQNRPPTERRRGPFRVGRSTTQTIW